MLVTYTQTAVFF